MTDETKTRLGRERLMAIDGKVVSGVTIRTDWKATAAAYLHRMNALEAQAQAAEGLLAALENVVDEMPPCAKDEARDYCVVHYTKHCEVEALVASARGAIAQAQAAGIRQAC